MTEHPHAKKYWIPWLGHLAEKPNVRGLEIGTFRGESAEWFCKNILTGSGSTLDCVDPFTGEPTQLATGIDCSHLKEEALKRLNGLPVNIYQQTSWAWLTKMLCHNSAPLYDFAYIDGAHDAVSVLSDAIMVWPIIKSGGIVIFDDYAWAVPQEPIDRPKMAIDAFCQIYARQLQVMSPVGWQLAVRKIA